MQQVRKEICRVKENLVKEKQVGSERFQNSGEAISKGTECQDPDIQKKKSYEDDPSTPIQKKCIKLQKIKQLLITSEYCGVHQTKF